MFDKVAQAGKENRFGKGAVGKKMGLLKDTMRRMKKGNIMDRNPLPSGNTVSKPELPSTASDTARKSIMKGFVNRK